MSVRRVVVGVVALVVAGCGSSGGGPAGGASGVGGEVVVFAAASLTETFTELGVGFEAAHPGVSVSFNFAGSSGLAQQIVQGAPVDVFAAASPVAMEQVVGGGAVVAEPRVFVRNRLQIAVPRGNPAGVVGLADLGRDELKVALCARQVPCGAASEEVFAAAGVVPRADTLEQDVKAVLTKVRLGEVDAALVYETDVKAAGGVVEGIGFPEADEGVNDYLIAPLGEAPNSAGAGAFVEYVLSEAGRRVFVDAGFVVP